MSRDEFRAWLDLSALQNWNMKETDFKHQSQQCQFFARLYEPYNTSLEVKAPTWQDVLAALPESVKVKPRKLQEVAHGR